MPSLLPQPGGFEGLGSLPIGPDPGDSAAAHGPNQCDALVHGKTAAPTPATDPVGGKHVVPGLEDAPLEIEVDLLERLEPGQKAASNIVEPATRSPVAPQSRDVVPFDLGVVKLGKRFPVLPPLSVEDGADDLDVLLRHRPSSIPRCTLRAPVRLFGFECAALKVGQTSPTT